MRSFFLLFIVLFISENLFSQNQGSNQEFISNYIAKQKTIKSLSCSFKQIKSSDLFQEDQVAEGKLFMKNQEQIRWEYTSPEKKIILLKDKTITSQDVNGKVDKYNFLDNPFIGKGFKLFEELANGELFNGDKFKSEITVLNEQQTLVTLIPEIKQLKKYINTLEITIDKMSYHVQKIIINDYSGDQTILYFSSIKTNEALPESLFSLEKTK